MLVRRTHICVRRTSTKSGLTLLAHHRAGESISIRWLSRQEIVVNGGGEGCGGGVASRPR